MLNHFRISKVILFAFCSGSMLFGQDVADPFRWLEDGNSPQTKEWVRRQDHKAEGYLATIPGQKKLGDRLRELYYVDSVSLPKPMGGRLFYKRTQAAREQPVFYWRPHDHPEMEHLWLDPAAFPGAGHAAVGDWVLSPDGTQAAYATHPQGADEATLHVRAVDSGLESPRDVIAGANFADVSWSPDSEGFYYMRLPMDRAIPPAERVAHADIRFHEIGGDSSRDALVYPPTQDASAYLTPQVSRDGRWLFVIVNRGWTSNDIFYTDRRGPAVHFKPLFTSTAAVADAVEWKGRFYLHTNQGAPHGKVLRKKPQEDTWETVIPERPDITIESMHLFGSHLVLSVLQNAANRVEVYRLDGRPVWQVPIPSEGKVWELSGLEEEDEFYIAYESFFVPPRIYRARLIAKTLDVWDEAKVAVDADRFASQLVWYTSKDGTRISMMVVQRKDIAHDGKAPLLMEGYGGFNTPILPRFSQEALVWMEMGGIYAVPHLRGGGEYGEAWHQAGMMTRKQNTFDDFISAAQYLIKEGYTRPQRLAIQGMSNGGLLVTAALTQRPEIFRAVLCKNPLTDMIRYPLFGEGKAWVPEYGSPDKENEYKALLAYSPYHRISAGAHYPSLLMFAGEHDDRVDPMHARKFVAALQAGNASKNPILFRLLPNSGHSGSDHLQVQVSEMTERLSFLRHELDAKE